MNVNSYFNINVISKTDQGQFDKLKKLGETAKMYRDMAASYPKNGRNDALAREAEQSYISTKNLLKSKGLNLDLTA